MRNGIQINRITLIFLLSGVIIPQLTLAQETDTTKITNIEFITDQLENIAQQTDLNLDYSDLLDDLQYYAQNPINLNTDADELVKLYLINDIQLNNINAYISKYGPLYSIYELKSVPGFDNQTIQNILPFITVLPAKERTAFEPKKAFRYGKHQLILRYNQVMESSSGYTMPPDSGISYPGSVYLGIPQAYYARYGFNYKNKIRFGFTLDKDAGEVFLKSSLNDSLNQLVGKKINNVFDFYSGHVYVSDIGILQQAVVGDYHLEFGQGLTLWTGLSFGKSAEGVNIKRFGRNIKPNTSANENRFFRGAAATIGWKGISFTGFYSRNKVDATLNAFLTEDDKELQTIIETGYHRTVNELLKKDALTITAYGGRATYRYKFFKIGATAYQTRLDKAMIPSDDVYRYFTFSGDLLTNYGVDLNFDFNKFGLFGELSASSNGGLAGIGGLNALLSDRFTFTLVYHNYGKDFQNLYNNPFSVSNAMQNESGIYFGFRALVHKKWTLSGYIDHYWFPWLKYRIDGPSVGRDYLLQLSYTTARNMNMYFRYRFKQKQQNYAEPYDYTEKLIDLNRHEFRVFLNYQVFDFLIFKNRLDMIMYKEEFHEQEFGYLIYQDILYRPERFPLEATFRYALFDTRSYDSRIYTYENDVLYAFTIPAYFNKGQRIYLMLRWKALKQLDVWLRLARTTYFNRTSIGSGSDEIDGKRKTEVKVQVRLKL